MTKLQKFNQILFAIIGTAATIGIIMAIYSQISNIWRSDKSNEPLNNQEVRELVKKKKFKQVISYRMGEPAWEYRKTLLNGQIEKHPSHYHIIPISHSTLEKKQTLQKIRLSSPRSDSSYDNYSNYRRHYNNLNNLLIYNTKKGTSHTLFKDRILVTSYQHHHKFDHFLTIHTQDLSQAKISHNSAHDIYIYKFKDKSLIKLDLPNVKVESYDLIENTPFIFIYAKKDYDKNGTIDQHDPLQIYSWNYETGEIKNFPDAKIHEELQRTLIGRNLTKM